MNFHSGFSHVGVEFEEKQTRGEKGGGREKHAQGQREINQKINKTSNNKLKVICVSYL